MNMNEIFPYWNKKSTEAFVGRTIVKVRYLTQKEQNTLDWYESSVVLQLDNGHFIFPSMDDEGNGAGALFIKGKKANTVAPVVNVPRDATSFLPQFRKELQMSKIVKAEYMPSAEATELGWYSSPLVITLENGVSFMPQRDDEGNDGGAYFTTMKDFGTIPVIGTYVADGEPKSDKELLEEKGV